MKLLLGGRLRNEYIPSSRWYSVVSERKSSEMNEPYHGPSLNPSPQNDRGGEGRGVYPRERVPNRPVSWVFAGTSILASWAGESES